MPPTSIRLPKKIEDRVRKLAEDERRTFSNMLTFLVERGLEIEELTIVSDTETHRVIGVTLPSAPSGNDPHFKPDFK